MALELMAFRDFVLKSVKQDNEQLLGKRMVVGNMFNTDEVCVDYFSIRKHKSGDLYLVVKWRGLARLEWIRIEQQ